MQTAILLMLLLVAAAGALGGMVNALTTDNGFLLPRKEAASGGTMIWRPGYLGNTLIGAIAAIISWGLYGPLSALFIAGTKEAMEKNAQSASIGLSLASLVGAVLVGVGGARWLSNEVDKNLLRAAAAQAASKQPSSELAQQISLASPAQALNLARDMK
ncbi:hypothetical protein P12x_005317 [Tundrisphaera lichenicola]|uniref:hypothetical protein n=1 Tax=Tundrisphaera lichenicola TaxID=2029860 RepID=UPI003EB8B645